jgi:SAM-dependent methyltransferase
MARSTLQVAASNTDQARAWDGAEGAYWAEHAQRFDRSLAGYHENFMAAAAIAPGDRVLDIGCGTGETTRHAARTARDGSALGVDLSARMVELARTLAADRGIDNVEFEQGDAQIHDFQPESFDAVISRTGTMFFGDPSAAFDNIAGALRPGGRLTMLVWQGPEANEWIRSLTGALAAGRALPAPPPAAPGPFSLAAPARLDELLTATGFTGIDVEAAHAAMWFGSNADEAHAFVLGMLGWMLNGLDDSTRTRAVDDLRDTLVAHESIAGILFDSAAWLVRASKREDGL